MKKKVAYVINRIENGGPSNVVLGIIKHIDRTQFEPVLVLLFNGSDQTITQELRHKGITVIECRNDSRMRYMLYGHKELEKIITKNKIDVIHSHGFMPDIASSRIHNNVTRINTVHNIMYEDYFYQYGKFKSMIYTKFHLWAMNKLDMCVCCSKSVHKIMQNYLKNSTFIRNGVAENNVNDGETREHLGIPQMAIVFIYVGCFSNRKRTVQLVNHFHCFHKENEYLLLMGNGSERKTCQEIQDDHIEYLGFQDNPYKYMNIADIYISASASEGFSMSIIEAMSCGLGLFLSDIPSHREFFEIFEDIYLGEIFSDGQFSDKIQKLRDNLSSIDKTKIKEFQRNYLSDDSMARQYESLY